MKNMPHSKELLELVEIIKIGVIRENALQLYSGLSKKEKKIIDKIVSGVDKQ